jgi:hypothetical protein
MPVVHKIASSSGNLFTFQPIFGFCGPKKFRLAYINQYLTYRQYIKFKDPLNYHFLIYEILVALKSL